MLIRRPPNTPAPETTSGEAPPPVKTLAKKKTMDKEAGAALAAKFIAMQEENEALVTIRRYREKIRNPKTAIRAKCVECSGGSLKEVAECRITECALHPFRMGVNPFNKKVQQRLGLAPGEVDPETEDDDDEES